MVREPAGALEYLHAPGCGHARAEQKAIHLVASGVGEASDLRIGHVEVPGEYVRLPAGPSLHSTTSTAQVRARERVRPYLSVHVGDPQRSLVELQADGVHSPALGPNPQAPLSMCSDLAC